MTPVAFLGVLGGIAAGGGVLILLLGRPLERILSSAAPQPLRPSAQTLEVER